MKYFPLLFLIVLSSLTVPLITSKNQARDERTVNFPKQEIQVSHIPAKENVWVYLMAGQSNMAGRGFVEPKDTIIHKRVLTINKNGKLIYAKEPLHFYEPSNTGLDMGISFAKRIASKTSDSISILIIPLAVGGSSIGQWIENKKHRNVELLKNFEDKVEIGKTYGKIKGILWHQGESNANNTPSISKYETNLSLLFSKFRKIVGNQNLPIVVGELGNYSTTKKNWEKLNSKIRSYANTDLNVKIVSASGLTDKGDKLHFDSKSLRILGKRYAEKMLAHANDPHDLGPYSPQMP